MFVSRFLYVGEQHQFQRIQGLQRYLMDSNFTCSAGAPGPNRNWIERVQPARTTSPRLASERRTRTRARAIYCQFPGVKVARVGSLRNANIDLRKYIPTTLLVGHRPIDMYWVYSLPNWLFGLLTVGLFVAFSVAGIFCTRAWIRRMHVRLSHNDIVGFYLAGLTVLYGVSLGLLAIGAWTIYTETENKVAQEAADLSGLYGSVSALPEPTRSLLQNDLREYTRWVIDVGWPQQRRGITDNSVTPEKFQVDFESFEPVTEEQKILVADITREFDSLEESRSIRLDSVAAELPPPLWALILLGALICIVATWFFHTESLKMHIWMTGLIAALLGLMVYMVAVLDNPYRGAVSVSPAPFERVYSQMATPGK
jgi:hypothetical protein